LENRRETAHSKLKWLLFKNALEYRPKFGLVLKIIEHFKKMKV